VPNDANMWALDGNGNLHWTDDYAASAFDEKVTLNGECIATAVRRFATRSESQRADLRFLGGFSDAMRLDSCTTGQPAPNWCERCDLFANHEDLPPGATRQDRYVACASGDLRTILGPPPTGDIYRIVQGCQLCPANYYSPDGISCVLIAPGSCPASAPLSWFDPAQDSWTCVAQCPDGYYEENSICYRDVVID
jgi:hypothetical protein